MVRKCFSDRSRQIAILPALSIVLFASLTDVGALTTPDHVSLAQALMHAGFPELMGQGFEAHVSLRPEFDQDWNTSLVAVYVWPPGKPEAPASTLEGRDRQFLSGLIRMYVTGSIELASFYGRHVHSEEMRLLKNSIESHPDWTDTDIRQELFKMGAQYGPSERDRFLKGLNLKRFETLFGRVQHTATRFRWYLEMPDGSRPIVQPSWDVALEGKASGRRMCYSLNFEPMTGHLTDVYHSLCR